MANIELIKANLKAKIQKGLYKLVMQESQSPTREIFKKFAMIATENGRFWEGYASCTNCSEIITQADLYRHQCINTTRAKEVIQSEDETEDETNIDENKDMSPTSSEPKIWQIFQLNLLEHGDTFKPRLYCRQCCAVLKNEYSTKKQRQTHKCLAVAGERESLKVMPTSNEVLDRIKWEISKRIDAGLYKLTMNRYSKCCVWKILALITKSNDGSVIKGFVCCTKCAMVMKNDCKQSSMANLYRHGCIVDYEDELKSGKLKAKDEAMDKQEVSMEKQQGDNIIIPVWQIFELTLTADKHMLDALITCRQCRKVLKCDYNIANKLQDPQTHKCLAVTEGECQKVMPYQHEIQEQIIFEISKNIKAGIFKTTPNRESKSFIWRTLEFITNSDGAILKGYICCTKCGQIFKYIGRRTSKIYRHPCISGNEVVSVLKNGTITVPNDWLEQQQTANNMNPTWQIFDVTLKEDGNNLEAVISCRLCKVILKYDDSLKTVAQPQTHKCLTLKDGENLKAMPYQHELEEQIVLEIGKKICSGLFKLTMKRNNKSLIWKICALILNTNGSIINGYIYCTKCTNILKHSGNRYSRALYKHECISSYENEGGFDSLNSADVVDNTVTVSKERVENLISPIWQIFDLTLTEDGHTLNYLMTCRQCNMALKRNNKATNQKHKCLAAKGGEELIEMPYPHEVEEKIIYEIRKNMEAGIYKSKMKRYSKSVIWNVFSEIANTNGKILFGYIYCTKCAKIFKHSGTQYSGHIYRHGCLSAEDVDDDGIDSKDETVANSKESVQGEAMDITKEIWQTFDLALTEDGNNLDVLITCSQCNMTITKDAINLQKPHKCSEGKSSSNVLLLPSQDAIEDRILLEIGKKLHAGIFKLIKNGFGKSFIWKIFTFITNGKGNVFNEYMYCTMCGKIIKYGEKFTNKIYKHACLSSTKIHSDAVRSLKFDETRTSSNAKDTRGINKDNTLIPIWQMFDLKLMEKDNKLTGLISCRTCNLVLDYDYTLSNVTQQQQHKCLEVEEEGDNDVKIMPYHNEVEERIRFEIRKKIDTGDYKLIMDPNPKTLIARVFSLIEDNANGKTINGYVSCTNCNILLKSNGKRGTDLRLHLCYRSQKNIEERSNFPNISGEDGATKSHDMIKRKVLSGSKLRMERKKQLEQRRIEVINNLITSEYKLTKLNNRNDMWSVFAAITKQDGTPVKEYLYCSKCRAILKCDGCKTRIFKQHPCLGQMFGKAKGGPTSKTKSMMEREETTSTTSMDTSSDEDVYESRVKKRRKDKLDFIHDSQSTMQYEVEGSSSYSMCIKEEYNYNELSDESLAMARNEMNDYHNRIKNSDVPMETIEYVIYEIDPMTHIYNSKEAVSIKEEIKDPIWIKEELNSSADEM